MIENSREQRADDGENPSLRDGDQHEGAAVDVSAEGSVRL